MTSTTQDTTAAWAELEKSVRTTLETYSNVHRGSGHFSVVTSALFERARDLVLQFVGLDEKRHTVTFCTPQRAAMLSARFGTEVLRCLSSEELGLPLGVCALVMKKSTLRRGIPLETGGGTARLVARDWVVWAKIPGRFEAGTPAIVNVIAFARALDLLRQHPMTTFEHSLDGCESVATLVHRDSLDTLSGVELLNALRQTHIGRATRVPTRDGERAYVNLDNAASTPTFAPILDTFCAAMRLSADGCDAVIREVRSICASALGAPASEYQVVFTSNTTEAINLVARSLGNETTSAFEPVILNTLLEHNSNELPWRTVFGHSLVRLPADDDGIIDVTALEEVLKAYNQEERYGKQRIRLVAVTGASNVLGTFNDIARIASVTHEYGARLLVDGAQLVAHRKVDMVACDIDYLAFSAHKMYAPFGSGALVVRKGLLTFDPQAMGSIEASSVANAAGIAALGKAFVLLDRISMEVVQREEQMLTAQALERLSTLRGIRIFGIASSKSPRFAQKGGVIPFVLKNCMPKKSAELLAEIGAVGVRYGCHCSHILVKRLHRVPPFLERVQRLIVSLFPKLELPGVVRVSLGIENTVEHVDALVAALNTILAKSQVAAHATPFRTRMREFLNSVTRRVYG